MERFWKFKTCDEELAAALAGTGGAGCAPLARLLAQRGCRTAEDVARFMNPSLASLRDPLEMPAMEAAASRVCRALEAGERIAVFGDYDVDGVCSTAMTVRVLRELGGTVSFFIPSRFDDGYGLSEEALAACMESGRPDLVITVDCGTNAVAAVEKARAAGVDVVVTDHHEPDARLAPAVAVVNPKCVPDHPDRNLAGVGVAFKLCHAVVKTARNRGWTPSFTVDLRRYLDYVAVATITDMVPLLGENRALVRAGLQSLESSEWAGWNALKTLAGISGPVETWHAGFAFGPRINAAGRIGRADAALELLLTDSPVRAAELAQLLDAANRERQLIEKSIFQEAVEEIDGSFSQGSRFGLVVAREGWHPGVVGIVASRLVARYSRPVVVIGMDGGSGRGSCRSIDAFHLLDGLGACSGVLKQFGGHAMAAGVEVEACNLDRFKELFNEAAASRLTEADLRPVLEIDSVISLAEAGPQLLDGLQRAGPFGQDNPEPVWAAMNVQPVDRRILKEKHLKLTLSDGRVQCEAIGFNMAEKLPSGPVDIAFTLQSNNWNGRTTVQLNLRDIRSASS